MNIAIEIDRAAFLHHHAVGQATPDHLADTHLHHLGAAGEAHLDADAAFSARIASLQQRPLDLIGVEDRKRVFQLRRCARETLRFVEPFGQ
ncbi:hypothetical protein ACFSTI_21700 [Rhizorhabdus histidinilytica]